MINIAINNKGKRRGFNYLMIVLLGACILGNLLVISFYYICIFMLKKEDNERDILFIEEWKKNNS